MATVLLHSDCIEGTSLSLRTFSENVQSHQQQNCKYKLVKATHYKERTVLGHEFLVLDIFDGEKVVYLRVERRPITNKRERLSTTATDDQISRAPRNFDPLSFHKILTMRCPAKPVFSLSDVCSVFDMIGDTSADCPVEYQCYRFCAMFLSDLETKVKVAKNHGRDYGLRGTFGKAGRVPEDAPASVKTDIDEYNERPSNREDAKRRAVKQLFSVAVEQRQRSSADAAKKTLEAISPFLETSVDKEKTSKLAIKSAVSAMLGPQEGGHI
ncbi:hypothetical protein SCP_0509090 [Sparassis crispa]|uniref:Uncharacterized protein n=1 Tax=Sparassis crispa TaxID=139825 RepID=A0A401GNS4_9APHY|nr:hypothetical protein SCP_0509090 [Sparassis crispa]GBE83852.1 hypothetical protein SCP_0509090 [Sparassis crispa]